MTIDQAMQQAVQHFFANELPETEKILRQVLAQQPTHAAATHILGLVAHRVGRHELAAELLERAITLTPNDSAIYGNLAEIYRTLHRDHDAVIVARKAVEISPNDPILLNNLGLAYMQSKNYRQAIDAFRKVLDIRSDLLDGWCMLGVSLHASGKDDEAVAAYRQALARKVDFEPAIVQIAPLLKGMGKLDEAIEMYRLWANLRPEHAEARLEYALSLQAAGRSSEAADQFAKVIEINPNIADAHNQLGALMLKSGKLKEALAHGRKAVQLKADNGVAWHNLGLTLQTAGRLDESIDAFEKACQLRPKMAEAWGNLASLLKEAGQTEDAINAYRKAAALKSDWHAVQSSMLLLLHSDPRLDAEAVFAEHKKWARVQAAPLAKNIPPHDNDRTVDRRLRIGYLSPDFKQGPVAHSLLPLLYLHNREQFEAYCYSTVRKPDMVTQKLQAQAEVWRHVAGLTDTRVVEMIREDKIDILVDLSLHLPSNRIFVFARKPAPVQITCIGYPSTTGLTTIDYRFTDSNLDPPGFNDAAYSESTMRLADCLWCYDPLGDTPDVNDLPANSNTFITFGCFNPFYSITTEALQLWARILRALPQSRLILQALEGRHQQRVKDLFQQEGVAGNRIEFVGRKTRDEQLLLYRRIDIALDTFPMGGQMAVCDALWMGIPVITRPGKTAVSRSGLSILNNVGMGRFVGWSPEEYVRVATDLGRDLDRLQTLRALLRERMHDSALMDAERYTHDVESAYREVWRRWCNSETK